MSWLVGRAVWNHSKQTYGARMVMLCLAEHSNEDGLSYPSHATIARECAITERQVMRIIPELIKSGELKIVERGNGRGNLTQYQITLPIEKGDIYDKKGDIYSNNGHVKGDIYGTERVTSAPERVTSVAVKGDICSTIEPKEPIEPNKNHKGPVHPVWKLPENLSTDNFEQTWILWYRHKNDIGDALTQTAGEMVLEELSIWGEQRAVAAIKHSISKKWKNIYESRERESKAVIVDDQSGGYYV